LNTIAKLIYQSKYFLFFIILSTNVFSQGDSINMNLNRYKIDSCFHKILSDYLQYEDSLNQNIVYLFDSFDSKIYIKPISMKERYKSKNDLGFFEIDNRVFLFSKSYSFLMLTDETRTFDFKVYGADHLFTDLVDEENLNIVNVCYDNIKYKVYLSYLLK
jgi:hypothetical protein